ncbi:hypothetical protein CEXT_714881 [Caerostris extrusa]|uniref:Uncharacterized protein n=1 Tax=Caerostris extrusa TaxID=172846 RepID=A0AAV4XPS6_CAEEX|nr:hypothetical protein CEXT_714881 [Caerostris extrusa]
MMLTRKYLPISSFREIVFCGIDWAHEAADRVSLGSPTAQLVSDRCVRQQSGTEQMLLTIGKRSHGKRCGCSDLTNNQHTHRKIVKKRTTSNRHVKTVGPRAQV